MAAHKDLFDRLTEDHEGLRALLSKLRGATAADARDELVARLHHDFALHTGPEEEAVYAPLIEAHQLEGLPEQLQDEHENMRELLGYLATLEPEDARWNRAFEELSAAVEEHLEKEETDFFAAIRDLTDERDRAAMEREFALRKRRLQTEIRAA